MGLERHQPHSRRVLLTAALGGVASVVATALGRPFEIRAADGEPVLIGADNEGTTATVIARTTKGPAVEILSKSDDGGPGLEVGSWYGDALRVTVGDVDQVAIRAYSDIGTAISARGDIGQAVEAIGDTAIHATGTSQGVLAEARAGSWGTAVKAVSTDLEGHALVTTGRIQFGQASGVATIASGSRQVTITPAVKVSSATKVLTTLQSSAGGTTVVHRISRNIPANSFTIYLTKAATQRCYVAWFLIG